MRARRTRKRMTVTYGETDVGDEEGRLHCL